MPLQMGDDHTMEVLGRIERALARIEAAAGRRPAPHGNEGELLALRDTHSALRSRVEEAIGEIDRMLAGTEGS
jgi:hypothetical protein